MNKRILIITNRADIHADMVIEKARQKGGNPFRINLDEFPKDFVVNMEFTPQTGKWIGFLTIVPSQETLSIADIGAVWVRKAADFSFSADGLSPQEKAYAAKETEHIFFGFLFGLDCYWMSHPLAIRSALWKGEQLLRAARFGFQVPASVITNRADTVRKFREVSDEEIVFKSLSSPFLAADLVDSSDRIAAGLPTTRITADHASLLDAVEESPCFFQEYVAKKYELRVTVIGDQVFAAKIHSQDDERTRTDYRDFSAEITYEAVNLPPRVELLCREFVQSYGLTFGALDLIVTRDDDYVFLENNPGGQFLFVEQLVPELRMTDAVAEWLISGARSES